MSHRILAHPRLKRLSSTDSTEFSRAEIDGHSRVCACSLSPCSRIDVNAILCEDFDHLFRSSSNSCAACAPRCIRGTRYELCVLEAQEATYMIGKTNNRQ